MTDFYLVSQDKTSVVALAVLVPRAHRSKPLRSVVVLVLLLVVQVATNRHRTNRHPQVPVSLVVSMLHSPLVLVVQAATNRHRSPAALDMVVMLLSLMSEPLVHRASNPRRQPLKFHNTLPMLKVSSKILTHKSSVVPQPVPFKPTLRTSKCASFNHHPSHHQA